MILYNSYFVVFPFCMFDFCFHISISTCRNAVSCVPAFLRFYDFSIFVSLYLFAKVPGQLAWKKRNVVFCKIECFRQPAFCKMARGWRGRRDFDFKWFECCRASCLLCSISVSVQTFPHAAEPFLVYLRFPSLLRFLDFRFFLFICKSARAARLKTTQRCLLQNQILFC